MASRGGELRVKAVGARSAARDVDRTAHSVRGLDTASRQASTGLCPLGPLMRGLVAGAGYAAVALGGLAVVLGKRGYDAVTQSQKVTKQTTAVLKSTGGIAGVTARQVDELSTSVSRRTDLRPHALDRRAGNAAGIDDEAIRSGENLLLTLTNVVRAEGLRPWLWTVDPEDWRPGATPDRIQAVAGGAAGG